jgi:20S proteasome alpha/beta subunit
MPGFLTRGVLVGDTKITLRYQNGSMQAYEGVQKIYAVAHNIAMGFAGNIDTGLLMVSDFGVFMRNSVGQGCRRS